MLSKRLMLLASIAAISVCTALTASAGEARSDTAKQCVITIEFPINKAVVERSFADNASALDRLDQLLKAGNGRGSDYEIDKVIVEATASPDGNMAFNERLARSRMMALRSYILTNYAIDPTIVETGRSFIPWDELRALIAESSLPGKLTLDRICSIGSDRSATDTHHRLSLLKSHNRGRTWRILADEILPQLRYASAVTVVIDLPQGAGENPDPTEKPTTELTEPETVPADIAATEAETKTAPDPGCLSVWHISTNAMEWGMLIANIAGEWDFHCRWSARLSLHYSAWNYFKSTRKFRTFILRPEVRWWSGNSHRGFFIDAHLQMAAYNCAMPGWSYRLQDTDGKHPALGGGVGAGYRLLLGSNGRWAIEGAIGLGVYHLRYDRFANRPNGPLVDTRTRTWAGVDNVAVSVVYNFNSTAR